MYSQENYYWGLVCYGLGVAFMLPLLWWLTRLVMPWRPLRTLIRLFCLVVLLTPVRAYTDMSFLAPAWMVAVFESLKPTSIEGPARAVTPMVTLFGALLLLSIGYYSLRYYLALQKARNDTKQQ